MAWLQRPWALLLLCLAGALPLLYPDIPPLTDVGGHLGRFAVQLDGGSDDQLAAWYTYHWRLTPNLGVDALIQVLGPMLGVQMALKWIVIAIPVLQIAGFLALARACHGHVTATALLAVPLACSYPFHFGFLNFTLGLALATLALALWIGTAKRDRPLARWIGFAAIACVLWVCHILAWVVFAIVAGADQLMRRNGRPGIIDLRAVGGAIMPLSCLLLPWLLTLLSPSNRLSSRTLEFFDFAGKAGALIMPLRDRWAVWDIAGALIILGMIIWAWRSRRFQLHPGLALGAGGIMALFLLMPNVFFGMGYASTRLAPIGLAIALIASAPRGGESRLHARLAVLGLLFVAARFAGNGVSLAMWDRQLSRDLAVLEAVPRNSNLVSLLATSCADARAWNRERRSHLAGYALSRRHAFASDQWTEGAGHALEVHNPAVGRFTSDPSQHVFHGRCDDHGALLATVAEVPGTVPYLWLIGHEERGQQFPGWRGIARSGQSSLFRREAVVPPAK